MALIDSRHDCSDPGYIHIVVAPVGEKASDALCARVVGALRDAPPVQLKDSVVFPRVVKRGDLPKWAEHHLRWEELSPYKQVFGELLVACCSDRDDMKAVEALVEATPRQTNDEYRRTLCCTKCLLVGPKEQLKDLTEAKGDFYFVCAEENESLDAKAIENAVSEIALRVACALHQQIDAASKQDSVKVFRSQFDVKNPSAEEDVRNFGRGVVQGRTQKHLGDLKLLIGQFQDASSYYTDAVSSLSSARDPLWLASAYEGLCTVAIMSKRCEDVIGQKAHHTKLKRPSLLSATLKAATSGTLSRWFSIRKNAESSSSVGDQGGPSSFSTQSFAAEKDMKDGPDNSSSSSSSVGGDGETGEEEQLRVDFIIKNYSRALDNYRKAGPIGDVPRIEATIRFTAFLANQQLYADACEVLNDLSTLTTIQDEDKVTIFEMMGGFCSSLGYTRKAAFYYHCAAKLTVASKVSTNGNKTIELLKKTFEGYRLPLIDNGLPTGSTAYIAGWPSLKLCILRDFVTCASSRDEGAIVWCATFLLQQYGTLLQLTDLQEIIEILTATIRNWNQNVSSDLALVLPTSCIDAPLPLTRVPIVNSFRPSEFQLELTLHRRPDYVSEGSGDGPFIYSALKGRRKEVRQEVAWVIGHTCEVAMEIINPLPVNLRIDEMKALVDGVSAEAYSASLTLPVSSAPHSFSLIIVPKETGFLNILGYEVVLFGLRSKCLIKIPGDPIVKVVSPLPMLRVKSTRMVPLPSGCPKATPTKGGLSVTDEKNNVLQLMDGESCVCEFEVESVDSTAVEHLSIASEEWDRDYCQVSYDKEAIASSLPLTKGQLTTIRVTITAHIPSYLRVNNDFTRGIAKSSLLSYSPGTITRRFSSSPEKATMDLELASFTTNGSSSPPFRDRRGAKTSTLPRQLPSQSPSGGFRTVSVRKRVGYDEIDLSKMQHRRSLRFPDGSPASSPDQLRHQVVISSGSDSVSMYKSETVPAGMVGHGGREGGLVDSLCTPPSSPATSTVRGGVVISGPTGPLHKAVAMPTSKRRVVCSLQLSYSGGAGHSSEYCRMCELRASFNIKPSLMFENFDVFQVKGFHHLWCLRFEVKNLSKSDLNISIIISPECSDAPECTGKLEFNLPAKKEKPVTLKLKRFLIPDSEMMDTVGQSNVIKMYCDRIAKWIRLHWCNTTNRLEGVVDLTGLRLPMATMDYIKPAPVQFAMKLNEKQCVFRDEVLDCQVGMPIHMVLDITNTSGFPLPSSTLRIVPFQFSEQENKIKAVVENLFIHTNTLTTPVPPLGTGCSFTHNMFLIFLFRGTYHVNMNLSTEDSPGAADVRTGEEGGRGGVAGSSPSDNINLSKKSPTPQAGPHPKITVSVKSPTPTHSSSPAPPPLSPFSQQFQGRQFSGPHIILCVT